MFFPRLSLVLCFLALLSVPLAGASAQDAPRRDARFVLELTAGGEMDYLPSTGRGRWRHLGWRQRGVTMWNGWGDPYTSYRTETVARTVPFIGPLGAVRCFLGGALPELSPGVALAFGYSGQFAMGVEQIDDDGTVLVHRHALAAALRLDGFVVSLSAGYVRAAVWDQDIEMDVDGWFVDVDPGLVVEGFTLRMPIGVDVWQDSGTLPAVRAGLSVGGTML